MLSVARRLWELARRLTKTEHHRLSRPRVVSRYHAAGQAQRRKED